MFQVSRGPSFLKRFIGSLGQSGSPTSPSEIIRTLQNEVNSSRIFIFFKHFSSPKERRTQEARCIRLGTLFCALLLILLRSSSSTPPTLQNLSKLDSSSSSISLLIVSATCWRSKTHFPAFQAPYCTMCESFISLIRCTQRVFDFFRYLRLRILPGHCFWRCLSSGKKGSGP